MTAQEERCELIQKAQQGDKEAMEQLVTQNSPLVWSIVRRFLGRGVEKDDLYQLGCMGLLKAVEGFDPAFATQFSTYAVPKIAGEIRRFLRDDGLLKVSRSVKENQNRVMAARARLEGRESPPPAPPQQKELAPARLVVDLGKDPEALTDDQAALLRALQARGEQSADDLVEATGIPARRVLSALTLLQVRQWVAEAGRRFTTLVELKEERTHPPRG